MADGRVDLPLVKEWNGMQSKAAGVTNPLSSPFIPAGQPVVVLRVDYTAGCFFPIGGHLTESLTPH